MDRYPATERSDTWDGVHSVELGRAQKIAGGAWSRKGNLRCRVRPPLWKGRICRRLMDPRLPSQELFRSLFLFPCPFRCRLFPLFRSSFRPLPPPPTRIVRRLRPGGDSRFASYARSEKMAGRIRRRPPKRNGPRRMKWVGIALLPRTPPRTPRTLWLENEIGRQRMWWISRKSPKEIRRSDAVRVIFTWPLPRRRK